MKTEEMVQQVKDYIHKMYTTYSMGCQVGYPGQTIVYDHPTQVLSVEQLITRIREACDELTDKLQQHKEEARDAKAWEYNAKFAGQRLTDAYREIARLEKKLQRERKSNAVRKAREKWTYRKLNRHFAKVPHQNIRKRKRW